MTFSQYMGWGCVWWVSQARLPFMYCQYKYFSPLHTGCLARLIGNVLRGYVRCPTCKTDTMVPGLTNQVTKLSKNFGVLDLLEGIDEENAAAAEVSVTNTVSCETNWLTLLYLLRTCSHTSDVCELADILILSDCIRSFHVVRDWPHKGLGVLKSSPLVLFWEEALAFWQHGQTINRDKLVIVYLTWARIHKRVKPRLKFSPGLSLK